MAIVIKMKPSFTAEKLLADLKKGIKDGEIKTWKDDAEGDFDYLAPQYHKLAFLRPFFEKDIFSFRIGKYPDKDIDDAMTGIYYGRFIEILIGHFNARIESITYR